VELGQHTGPELVQNSKGHVVIDCRECGFAHLWPKPTAEELADYYNKSFYETHSPTDWAEKEEREQPYWEIEYSDRLSTFSDLLGRPAGKLLDVGCGGGWLLSFAKERGWDVLGIEPSRWMWERACKRSPVLLGVFPGVDVSAHAPFDVVHLKLVMEHVSDALEVLQAANQVLRPGGFVVVQVPNDFNPLQLASQKLLNKDPWWVVHPVHVNYFNFDSLERVLRRCGFEPRARDATFPMEWFLLQGVDYIGRDDVGRKCHQQRMSLERNLETAGLSQVRRGFNRWLASQGIGREAVVYAVKQ
jgi:2-polyprenyl-3-methyl-5-hydroxy-6-metoxy-1,4-benzoquinol methylase